MAIKWPRIRMLSEWLYGFYARRKYPRGDFRYYGARMGASDSMAAWNRWIEDEGQALWIPPGDGFTLVAEPPPRDWFERMRPAHD